MLTKKAKAFWPLLLLLIFADCTTKRLAEEHLVPEHVPHPVVGDVVRFTLAYNPDAAFSFCTSCGRDLPPAEAEAEDSAPENTVSENETPEGPAPDA